MVDARRRLMLRGGVAVGALFAAAPYAELRAQSDGALKIMRAPKIALVLGNARYRDAPLKNPANDARAIAEALRQTGFEVNLQLDAGRAALQQALEQHLQVLSARKAVGLFYYAGHGIQLAWRNYMLPVDADIDVASDVQKQAVDINLLMEGIGRAGNPFNVVILDCCRDNPFGGLKGVDQKGLSQMDAPPGTLLAYATSPGNVASDGDGSNGLYTEQLLKEMRVPEAKIEDVFKRVRLNVRLKSRGQQIPWESTSLEEDFYFLPPAKLVKLSEAEAERQFQAELALWNRIKDSRDPVPFEDYLRNYPGGRYAELAQLRLDRLLSAAGETRIHIASQNDNPYTRGTSEISTAYRVGDRYTYRNLDQFSRVEQSRGTQTVVEVTDTEVIYSNGMITDLLGNRLKAHDGRIFTANQYFGQEYAIGKSWITRFNLTLPNGATGRNELTMRVVAREKVTVPAGTFDAFRIDVQGWAAGHRPQSIVLTETFWMAPDRVRRPVAWDARRLANGRIEMASRSELVDWKEG